MKSEMSDSYLYSFTFLLKSSNYSIEPFHLLIGFKSWVFSFVHCRLGRCLRFHLGPGLDA